MKDLEKRHDSNHEVKFQTQITRPKYSRIYNISCNKIFLIDKEEIGKSKKILKNLRNKKDSIDILSDRNFIFQKDKCDLFKRIRGYDRYYVEKSELEFPLAFTILTYNQVEQFERFLNLIYRPHNFYCIHIDENSSLEFKKAIKSIVRCFRNVFIASKLERIVYAGFSRLKADLNCMKDLLKISRKWKYLLNTASSEFPLRTNYELTRILNIYNGSNDIEVIKKFHLSRINKKWHVAKDENGKAILEATNITKGPPPHDYKIAKGYAYGAFSRRFIEYALNDKRSRDLLEWMKDIYSPDEW